MVQPVARAALIASVTAWRESTGRAPGSPRQTGQTLVLGSSPKRFRQGQKSLDLVSSWQWTSRPITGWYLATAVALLAAVLAMGGRDSSMRFPRPRCGRGAAAYWP